MKIYKVTRTDTISYDEFDSFICVAPNMDTAKNLIPTLALDGYEAHTWEEDNCYAFSSWTRDKNAIHAELLGIADATFDKTKILLASFNAG